MLRGHQGYESDRAQRRRSRSRSAGPTKQTPTGAGPSEDGTVNNGAWVRDHPGAVGPDIAARLEIASQVTADQERSAQTELGRMRQRIRALTEDAIVVLPSAPGPAPARTADGPAIEATRSATLRMTCLAAIGGLPALSAPFLTVPSSLGPAPVGVCFVGPAERDLDLLRWARSVDGRS